MKYPQLDGLRACAALLVIIHHGVTPSWTGPGNFGSMGVRIFFVLSGFLITDILLRARAEAADAGGTKSDILRAFYARRFLRVFPLYYAALLLAVTIGVKASYSYYLTYTSNVWMAFTHQFDPVLQHFWSLAIEEQFYLVWPWLVLWFPERHVRRMFVFTIAVAIALRFAVDSHASYLLMPTRMDAFAGGALLSALTPGWWRPATCVALSGVLLAIGIEPLYEVAFVLMSVAVVELALARRLAPLESRILVAIGGISYGLYVFHPMVTSVLAVIERTFDVWLRFPHDPGIVHGVLLLVISYVMAKISWHLLEAPLNALKKHFPYVAPSRAKTAGAPALQNVET